VTELIGEIEVFLARVRRPLRPWLDDGPPWYRCPDCDILWQPTLNLGCHRVRGRIHQCWADNDRQAG
jgi:hypothetical protein